MTDHTPRAEPNVQQVVPLLAVADMAASLRFYVDGLGFEMTNRWIDEGELRWCWFQLGGAATYTLTVSAVQPAEGTSAAHPRRLGSPDIAAGAVTPAPRDEPLLGVVAGYSCAMSD
ncbi:MAG: VOC family protein [Longimicrobiaceae bacterium]